VKGGLCIVDERLDPVFIRRNGFELGESETGGEWVLMRQAETKKRIAQSAQASSILGQHVPFQDSS
jgi:hypothetical protein